MTPEEIEYAGKIYEKIKSGSADGIDKNEGWLLFGYMRAHIDRQAAQIAALKEIAISEREKKTVLGFASSLHWNTPEKIEKTKAKVKEMARQQLEAEHPEAMR